MAILNLTPDSFSDGGQHASSTATLTETITSFVNAGATILDIGGCSTRPHSPQPSADEELARILPAIHLIRSLPCAHQFAISIDTYRASVAAAALDAGAHIINDVSAGLLDPALLPTVAAYPHASLVLSHMRGDPSSMTTLTQYPGGLLATIASELRARVAAAQDAGIARWRLLLDPGVGFAKTAAQNLELLRRLPELRAAPGLEGLPWLVGVSRKGFVGSVTGVREPRERGWGTAGAVAACVAGGAEVVRVHDVPEMVKVVRMADAVWRA
ncbi:MAG: hypothetical protein M1819_003251 [Sarea resinae]|nr:MAG: hypothetical protein M1819_003251 [Sarea resinae]